MKVEILYVAGCPNLEAARQAVARALAESRARAQVQSVLISEANQAAVKGFAGSPTILVNGRDVEPAPATGVACRLYANGTGCPSLETVRRAVARAQQEEAGCGPQE